MKYLAVGIWIIFRLPPYLRTPPDLSSAVLRVRWSISLPFGFTFRSHTNHIFVPPFFLSPKFLLRCYYFIFTSFLIACWNFVKFFQLSCHSQRLACLFGLSSALRKFVNFLLTSLAVCRWPPTFFGYLGVYFVASLWEGIIAFCTLLSFSRCRVPAACLPSLDG